MWKRLLIITMFVLLAQAVLGLDMCSDAIQINTNCTMATPKLSCATYNYTIINITNGAILKRQALSAVTLGVYQFNFTEGQGKYVVYLCDGTTREVNVTDRESGNLVLAAIILIPLLMGFIVMFAAFSLGEDHNALRIFLFLLTSVMFITSLNYGMLAVVKYYNFPELQNAIGSTTYWFGWVFAVLILYFMIYFIYKITLAVNENKKSKMEY